MQLVDADVQAIAALHAQGLAAGAGAAETASVEMATHATSVELGVGGDAGAQEGGQRGLGQRWRGRAAVLLRYAHERTA